MDSHRYARVRELFFAADELSGNERDAYLQLHIGDDEELMKEVLSLLAEHDPDSAKLEGERVIGLPTAVGIGASSVSESMPTHASAIETQPPGPSVLETKRALSRIVSPSEKTHGSAERTHASPRQFDSAKSSKPSSPSELLLASKSRRARRINSGWLWLAAILPTFAVGAWAYYRVMQSVRSALVNELTGVADSIDLAASRYLDDKVQLVLSWSRQERVRHSIVELVSLASEKSTIRELKDSLLPDGILEELKALSGTDSVKFVVWDKSLTTIASWQPDRGDIGNPVAPSGSADVARALRGETVIVGPMRLIDNTIGFIPETTDPVVSCIVPIYNDEKRIVAAMLVRGIGMYEQFNQLLHDTAINSGLDAYAVNRSGEMVSVSPHAASLYRLGRLELEPDAIAAHLRVSDPGHTISVNNVSEIQRHAMPLTYSVASATMGESQVKLDPYTNYAGEDVVGGWRYNEKWGYAIVVEKGVQEAFSAARTVGNSFMLLGSILTVTALLSASRMAKLAMRDQAAVHPLSRYEIISQLGSGGMGVVYRAHHRQLGRDTALKLLRSDRHNREDQLRFDREAKLAASLGNPHSVTIYDYGRSEEGEAYCVMEFLHGLTLQEIVARSGFQSVGRTLFILRQVCEALSEAHKRKLVHRDVKPQNIMLSLDASVGDWAVVFDYGLAKPLHPDNGMYQTNEVVWAGTPMYMAPERFRAPSVMDPRSDIYSVGCVAYYLLAGRPPFAECDPESLFALIISEEPLGIGIHRGENVPDTVGALVRKCMAKEAASRFQTIDELAGELDRLRAEYPWPVDEAITWWKKHGES